MTEQIAITAGFNSNNSRRGENPLTALRAMPSGTAVAILDCGEKRSATPRLAAGQRGAESVAAHRTKAVSALRFATVVQIAPVGSEVHGNILTVLVRRYGKLAAHAETAHDEKQSGHPLTRPAATLSPSDEERDGVRGWFDSVGGMTLVRLDRGWTAEPDCAAGHRRATTLPRGIRERIVLSAGRLL